MRHERHYARVYYDDLEREFPEVWRDAVLRGDYILMLVAAERAWPASPEVPRLARPRSVKRLAELELIYPEPPFHYRARGLDKERERRSEAARNAASTRWRNAERSADSSAVRTADAMPRRDETRRDDNKPPNPPRGGGRRANGTNRRAVEAAERAADRDRAAKARREQTQLTIHENGGHFEVRNLECPRCRAA